MTMVMASRCATISMEESYEEPPLGSGTGVSMELESTRRRRRHSSYTPMQWSAETDNVQALVSTEALVIRSIIADQLH